MNSTLTSPINTQTNLEKKWGRFGGYDDVEAQDIEKPLEDYTSPLDSIKATVIENPFGKLLGSLSFQRKDVKDITGAIGDLVFGEIAGIKVPEAFNKAFENEKLDPTLKKAQENAVFVQQANQNQQQERGRAISAEQQEIMMDVFRLGVDISEIDDKRKLTKHKVFAMATKQSENNKKVEKQIEQSNSQAVGGPGMNQNQAAEGGMLSAVTSAG
ncbi:MAG: hypothetical protein Q7R49_03525 [Candidatus Daviesbacteria bacterium]|nr:hypothetical protein [Candidatus Daviesbacteria bacterium]